MPLSDEEYDKLIYGATGKRPEPIPASGDITEGENFARGVRKGFAGNPMLAAQQYSGGAIPAPSWANDPKFRGNRFSGMAGEALGTIGSAAGTAWLGSQLIPEAVAARPFLGPLARGAIGAGSGVMARPAQNPWELGAQALGGGAAGAWRGGELAQMAQRSNALKAAEANANRLSGVASRTALNAQFARQEANRAINNPVERARLQTAALNAAQEAGLTRSEADRAIEALGRSPKGTFRWIMASPAHGLRHMIMRALAGAGGETIGRAPGSIGAAAGAYVGSGEEQ